MTVNVFIQVKADRVTKMHGVELLTRYLIALYFYATNDSIMY